MSCSNNPNSQNISNIISSRKSGGRRYARHSMPLNHKTDAAGVKGFTIGWHEKPGHKHTIMENANYPGHATHIHHHPNGITLSHYYPDGRVERVHLKMRPDSPKTNVGEETRWNPNDFGKWK